MAELVRERESLTRYVLTSADEDEVLTPAPQVGARHARRERENRDRGARRLLGEGEDVPNGFPRPEPCGLAQGVGRRDDLALLLWGQRRTAAWNVKKSSMTAANSDSARAAASSPPSLR